MNAGRRMLIHCIHMNRLFIMPAPFHKIGAIIFIFTCCVNRFYVFFCPFPVLRITGLQRGGADKQPVIQEEPKGGADPVRDQLGRQESPVPGDCRGGQEHRREQEPLSAE